MLASFEAVPDSNLPAVAQRYIDRFSPAPALRNTLQELLWAGDSGPAIPKKTRREIARSLKAADLFDDASRFDALITALWIIEDDPFAALLGGSNDSLRAGIDRYVYKYPGDWTPEDLFDRLGAYDSSDRRFRLFLEGLISAEVHPDEVEQHRIVALINQPLRRCGAELRETGSEGGYPIFTVVSLRDGPTRRPKNLIFASPVKPDLRFRDAVDNDIEIVTNADLVLVYDRPIGADGLRWSDLQAWWAEREGGLDEEAAKKTLYRRLRASLPSNSPPQHFLFDTFFKTFGAAVQHLPALLPEIWLHWDPKTVEERGADALARFRMDFLMLLPHGVRVVMEVDGRQHFSDDNGRGSPARYGAMMAADRELRLGGYEVFRFGAAELDSSDAARALVKAFFEALFKRHNVATTV
jgi:very-short-patch-repair endonuclease